MKSLRCALGRGCAGWGEGVLCRAGDVSRDIRGCVVIEDVLIHCIREFTRLLARGGSNATRLLALHM